MLGLVYGQVRKLLDAVTAAPANGVAVQPNGPKRTFQAIVTGTGAVSATVEIYGSNMAPSAPGQTGQQGLLLATIGLSATDTDTDGFATDATWAWVWAKLTAISGTGAAVSVLMGE